MTELVAVRPRRHEPTAKDAHQDLVSVLETAPKPIQSIDIDAFTKAYQPGSYVVEGLIQEGFLYSLTGKTGHAKTGTWTVAELMVSMGLPFAGLETKGGKVLVLCGENPNDKQARILAACQQFDLDPAGQIRVIAGSFSLATKLDEIRRDAEEHGPYVLVTVDTSAAYFSGVDENDNVQARQHAADLRELTTLPGNPAVVVLCHPTKSVSPDNLLPRGGGAFLNEVDGNLTVWRDGERVTLHWAGKLRGPGFEPIQFTLQRCSLAGHLDSKGRQIESVVTVPIDDAQAEQLARADWNDENRLLFAMLRNPEGSIADWARDCAWVGANDNPQKSKVFRLLATLESYKMVKKDRRKAVLTEAGKREAEAIK